MSISVENNNTNCYTKRNTSQPSLWDAQEKRGLPEGGVTLDAFPLTCTLPFRGADLARVQGYTRHLYNADFVNHRLVSYYLSTLDAWIEDGVVWGRCTLWPEGAYIEELRAGSVEEAEEDEE